MDQARLRRRINPDGSVGDIESGGSNLEPPLEPDTRIGHGRNASVSDSDKSSIDPVLDSVDASDNLANTTDNDTVRLLSREQQVSRNRSLWESTLPQPTIEYNQKLIPKFGMMS